MASSWENAGEICHACRATALKRFGGFEELPRVSSDCRPFATGGALAMCTRCSLVQKVVDANFRREADEIYATYSLYHQTTGETEQVIFDQESGEGRPRSELILASLLRDLDLPKRGRMLDMGCGTGPTLRAFSRLFEGWSLSGYDPHLPNRERVAQIPGVERIYEGGPETIDGTYDLVTAVHVLEHVPDPLAFLRTLKRCLGAHGAALVQVPYYPDSPFDLVVADHCSHFTLATVAHLFRRAGLEPVLLSADRLPKEITIVARPAARGEVESAPSPSSVASSVTACLEWLGAVRRQAIQTRSSPLGVFGTSIGGNWLFGVLQERVEFFVDEDPGRAGTRYRDRPVLRPEEVPPGAGLLVPLPPAIAARIQGRLKPHHYRFVLPPAYEALART